MKKVFSEAQSILTEKLAKMEFVGESGGGMVKVTVVHSASEYFLVKRVEIDERLVKVGEPVLISDLVVSATNKAILRFNDKLWEIADEFTRQLEKENSPGSDMLKDIIGGNKNSPGWGKGSGSGGVN